MNSVEDTPDYHTPAHITKHLTVDLVRQLEDKLACLVNGTGYGEVTIVVQAHRIKFVSAKEVERVDKTKLD